NIGMMAFVFGDYAIRLWGLERSAAVYFALLAVIVLSLVNVFGVVLGKGAQNILTAAKILGLGGILAAGLFWGRPSLATASPVSSSSSLFAGALVQVFFTYGGWNDAAFVAAELRNGRR